MDSSEGGMLQSSSCNGFCELLCNVSISYSSCVDGGATGLVLLKYLKEIEEI